MEKKVKVIFRKSSLFFHSIENVFNIIMPLLNAQKIELLFESKGLFNRLRNILFLMMRKEYALHITGHDHYLLWYPFKNTILTIHDIESYRRKSGLKKWVFKKLWFDIPIRNSKIITTVSEFSKNEILSLGNYLTPIEVIYNPLTLPLIFTPKEFNSAEPRILHLGTKKNKNLHRTIEALKGLNCHLTIVGTSDLNLKKLLELAEVKHTFKSNLSQDEMVNEFIECDLVSFVSTYEGFGLPIIEAQAIGRPVITSNITSMPEVAGNGAFLVDPFSADEIRKGILKIISDSSVRESLIANGLLNVKRFTPSVTAAQYADLYKTLLK